jgi:hypothetical protein
MLSTSVRSFGELLRPDVEVLRPTTGMGVVEAKLLEAYRDELAHLLLAASYSVFDSIEAPALAPRGADGRAHPVDATSVARCAAGLRDMAKRYPTHASGFQLLRRAFPVVSGMARPTPYELALASLRLVPGAKTRIWLGAYALHSGDPARCVELQRSALASPVSAIFRAHAWSNISVAMSASLRFESAIEAGREAAQAEPLLGRGSIAWLCAAVQAGSRLEVLRAADVLGGALVESSSELVEQVADLTRTRRAGRWHPTSVANRASTEAMCRVPAAAERILEVFY